jgi:hypothetical protein
MPYAVTWRSDSTYALVVGSYGEVIKYDGSSLSYLSASAYRTLWDAEWKPDNSYALIVSEYGELLKFNGSFFTFISTGDSSDFYYGYPCRLSWKPDGSYVLITGRRGSSPYYCLWKYDETSFEEITLRSYPCSVDWRQDGEYALIVGYAGQVVRYDGVSLLYHSASTSYNLWDVDWKPDGSYALIISQYGEVLKFFSVLFTHHTTGDSSDFYYNERCSVDWHPFGTYALITGRRGASPYYCLWRYDGATFTRFPLRNRAWDVEWRQDGVYSLMVGDRGQVVRYDGVSLLYHSASTSYNLWDVDWKPDGSYALIISQYGEVLKFNGWMVTYDVTGDSSDFYYNERCSVDWHDSGIWCVITGRRGSSPYYCLWRYDGATFVRVTLSTMARDVAFQPGGDYCIAVGDSGHAWTYDSINLLPLATGVTADLFGVSWKPDGTYALIVGKTGTILKYDGLFFTPLDSGTSQDLKAVAWSRDGSYALIAGVSGTVLRYNGTHFTQLDSGVTQELVSIDFGTTTALIAGRTGCLLKYDGGFASVPLNTTANLQAVAWAPTGNYAIVTALEGRMWKVYFGPPEAPLGVAVAADPSILHSSDISKITVDVSNGSTPISGATVQLRSNLEGTFSPVIDLGNGTYIANYTAPFVYRMTTDRIIATASKTGFTPGLGYIDVSVKPIEDLFVSEVELIQVTENPKALIGGKKTVFCAHIESSFGARIWTELEVEYNFLSSSYVETGPSGNGVPIDPGSNRIYIPGGPALPATSVPWISGSQPPWFNWSTIGIDSTIRVTVDPFDKIGEGNEINNVMEVQMKIVESKDLRILCVPVYFPDIQQLPLNPQLNDEMDFVLATYPVAEDRFFWAQSQPFPWPGVPPVPLNPNNQAQQAEFLEWLYWRVAVPISIMAVMLGYDRAVIVIHDMGQNWGGIAIGMLRFPENRVPVLITEGAREGAVAHEIGHTYYLWHPHDIGPTVYDAKRFWVLERDYEDVVSTFMSYLPPPLWIDPGRYDSDPKEWVQLNPFVGTWRWNLFEQLKVGIDPEIVIVQGEVHNNGTINADQPWFFLQEGIPDLLSQTSGNYSIYLLDNSSQALDYFGFNVSFSYFLDLNGTLTSIETECVPFVFKVPFLSGTRTIEIRNMTGHTLVSRLVSPNKPSVNVTFPNGGETLTSGANYTITWESFDLDGDQLYFSITYSTDAGQSWLPIATGLNQTSCVWNTSYLEPGTKYHIKVIASDGVNTCEDLSDDTFTVSTGTHDLALLGIECSKTTVGTGYDLQINVTISNMGDFTEVFNVNINANTTAVSTLTNITLPSGNSTTLTFTWNTTGFAKGNYTISANATIVSGETDTADNSYIDGTVRVNMVGDVAPEYGIVDIVDIVYVAIHFGAEKGQPEYEPNADINGDGIIDIVDIVIVAIHFGETDP